MIWEDSGDGTYYYPIEGSNMYMYVKYSVLRKEASDEFIQEENEVDD